MNPRPIEEYPVHGLLVWYPGVTCAKCKEEIKRRSQAIIQGMLNVETGKLDPKKERFVCVSCFFDV